MRNKRLILSAHLSLGDELIRTACLYSLHQVYPSQFVTDIRSSIPAVWEHNPHVTPLDTGLTIEQHYPSIDECSQVPHLFLEGYCKHLADELGILVPLRTNRPRIYFSDQELSEPRIVSEKYLVINTGVKQDFTVKQYPYYQDIVNALKHRITFVQVGESHHVHKPLNHVVNLLGQTNVRQLFNLIRNSVGTISGITANAHIAAACQQPCWVIGGGREGSWIHGYQLMRYFHTMGSLPCCLTGGCWRSRVVKLNDGSPCDNSL